MTDTRFPEDVFTPNLYNLDKYRKSVDAGRSFCQGKSIIFCGICRDIEDAISINIDRIYETSKLFKDYKIVIYENDSSDTTPEILKDYSDRDEKFHLLLGHREDANYREFDGEENFPFLRAKALADCRNEYINHISSLPDIDLFDYIVVIDLDIRGGWSYEGFLSSFGLEKSWDCVSSYGVLTDYYNHCSLEDMNPSCYLFFDSWAFRPPEVENVTVPDLMGYNHIYYERGEEPAYVNSNFSGLAIYKTKSFIPFRYATEKLEPPYSVNCDHPCLHRQMRKHGHKILINPSMIVSYSHHRYSQ